VIEEKWAQMERLEALEHTDLPSSIATVTPRFPPPIQLSARGAYTLVQWGFACACIAGAISLLAE
jgi:hypothetical protein